MLSIGCSLFFVFFKQGQVIVGYDNHYPKGPHKHIHGIEYPYEFTDIHKLLDDFLKDKQVYEERIKNESEGNAD